MTHRGSGDERAQATVELALVLPVVAVVVLVVLQVVAVLRDAAALPIAAGAAARSAMVDGDRDSAAAAATRSTRLRSGRMRVELSPAGGGRPGELVTVTVHYRAPTDVAVVGRFAPDVDLVERFVVRRE
ncbi:MAG: hypothetical protein R2698_05135 [Microthrixaceae bacterium]